MKVGALGFGAAPIGNLYQPVEPEQASSAVRCALQQGFQYFDTAPYYGLGLSESRLGSACRQQGAVPVISSKVGRLLEPMAESPGERVRYGFADSPALDVRFDYSYDGVMRSFESSLKRLQVERIDILLAHDLGRCTHGDNHTHYFRQFVEGGYRALSELKSAGQIGAIGIGANEWQIGAEAMDEVELDCFLLAGRYSLLDQSAAEGFFPLCASRDVSVILGGPFNSGILATGVLNRGQGETLHYDYQPAAPEVVDRVAAIETLCREHQVTLAAAALQFCCAHPQVTSVIAGLASPQQVESLVTLAEEAIPAAFWDQLQQHKLLNGQLPVPGEAA